MTPRAAAVKDGRRFALKAGSALPGHALTAASTASHCERGGTKNFPKLMVATEMIGFTESFI
jgi:hypothetical protein